MQSKAQTVDEYLASLPPDRREAISAIRKVILDNLDEDYEEGMTYGMIGYYVPHRVYPPGYHCNPKSPMPFANLASQKNYMALYLMSLYMGDGKEAPGQFAAWFCDQWTKTGKRLDIGKSCIRFKKLEDVPLDLIGKAIRRMPTRKFIEMYEASRAEYAETKSARKVASKRAAKKRK